MDVLCSNIDNREAVDQAMKCLIRNGHEKIALHSNDKNRQYNQERPESCMEAWGQYHQERSLTVIQDTMPEENARQRTMELMKSPDRPTTVFLFSDSVVDGVYSEVRKSGLTASNDISIAGFDDIPHAKYLNPPLTTVRHSLLEASKAIFDYLLSQAATRICAPYSSIYLKE